MLLWKVTSMLAGLLRMRMLDASPQVRQECTSWTCGSCPVIHLDDSKPCASLQWNRQSLPNQREREKRAAALRELIEQERKRILQEAAGKLGACIDPYHAISTNRKGF